MIAVDLVVWKWDIEGRVVFVRPNAEQDWSHRYQLAAGALAT
jgi:hypothetical protein